LKAKTGFESGSSPTLHVIRERITRAFDAIRVLPQERAKELTLESLACSYSSESRHKNVWEIKAPTQTAEELINEILREGV
jgi:translation elongation factor EF-Tu-like GTPase